MGLLDGRVAVITGGAGDIGRAAVTRFLSEGASVAAWDLNCSDALDGRLLSRKVEIRDMSAVEDAADAVIETFGRIDILVNNAGVSSAYTELDVMESAQWDELLASNLRSAVTCTQVLVSHMKAQGSGRIINVTGVLARHGYPGQTALVASKSALVGLTRVWAREFGPWGITVNAVSPGFIRGRMNDSSSQELVEEVIFRTPLHRIGEPCEVASAYLFLASSDASFITGTVLDVDGGFIP